MPLSILKKEKFSIIQIAEMVINFYKKLTAIDANYNRIKVISERNSLYENININDDTAIKHLADEILNRNIDDIRKIDKVENPDVNYSRDKSIIFSLEANIEKEPLITLNYSLSTLTPRIGSIVVNETCFDTFEKAKFFLETIKKSFPIEYSVIKISDRALNKVARGYKAPLGWVTYFSNDYEIPIPDDLEGIEYEHTDKGKYLILSREDITSDPEKLEVGKQKLIGLMEEIKRRVPEYGK